MASIVQLSTSSQGGREEDFTGFVKIGRGGFASVYQCCHKLDNKLYALKKIEIDTHKGKNSYPDSILDEVRQLSALQHPRIVRYFGCWLSTVQETQDCHNQSSSPQRSQKQLERQDCSFGPLKNQKGTELFDIDGEIVTSCDEEDSRKTLTQSSDFYQNSYSRDSFKIVIEEVNSHTNKSDPRSPYISPDFEPRKKLFSAKEELPRI